MTTNRIAALGQVARERLASMDRKTLIRIGLIAAAALAAIVVWMLAQPKGLPDGFASGNGRIEAVEIDIATRAPGRVAEILVEEGDLVSEGQVLARMDTSVLQAQMAEARAGLQQARSQAAMAQAVVVQREAELVAAHQRLRRSETLAAEGAAAQQQMDDDAANARGAEAAVDAARAQRAAANAAIETAEAAVARLQADIDDSELKAPRDGRIQFRIAQVGEVVAGGGRVLNLVDLTDVYMTFFLPEQATGQVALGSEVRLMLDAAPDRPIPATISFVSDVAQFTPRTVETESERQKLMFRVRARIDPDLLRANIHHVKTGLPGMAYVRLDPSQPWPANLSLRERSHD